MPSNLGVKESWSECVLEYLGENRVSEFALHSMCESWEVSEWVSEKVNVPSTLCVSERSVNEWVSVPSTHAVWEWEVSELSEFALYCVLVSE